MHCTLYFQLAAKLVRFGCLNIIRFGLLPQCRWLSIRLETLGALAAFSAAVLAIESRGAASQMGLTLSYALQITSLTSMTVRLASVAENAFNAVERMAEYSKLQGEAPAVIKKSAPDEWPTAGKV